MRASVRMNIQERLDESRRKKWTLALGRSPKQPPNLNRHDLSGVSTRVEYFLQESGAALRSSNRQ